MKRTQNVSTLDAVGERERGLSPDQVKRGQQSHSSSIVWDDRVAGENRVELYRVSRIISSAFASYHGKCPQVHVRPQSKHRWQKQAELAAEETLGPAGLRYDLSRLRVLESATAMFRFPH